MFVVDESKIVNRTYKDVMQVFSYDNANEIELPWSGQFLVLLRNQFGALPVVDYFEGNRYKLNEVIYHYRGSNVMEFIKVGGTRKTMVLVPLSVQVSAYNMENNGIKRAYIPELEKEIQKVLEVIRNSGANVTNKEKAFLNNLKFIEKELTDKSNVVFGKVEEVLNEVALVDQESERFLSLVRENERLVDEKYHKFDVSVTTANQTIDDILALQPQFQAVIDETTGKDVISAPEIILARGGETDLKTRLDKEHQEVTAQLAQTTTQTLSEINELDRTKVGDGVLAEMGDLSQDVKEAMTGGSVAVVGEGAVTKANLANDVKSEVENKIEEETFKLVHGKNHFNKDFIFPDMAINETGEIYSASGWVTSDFITVEPSTQMVVNNPRFISEYDKNKKFIAGTRKNIKLPVETTWSTDVQTRYIRVTTTNSLNGINTLQVEKGSVSTPHEPYVVPKLVTNRGEPVEVSKVSDIGIEFTVEIGGKNLFDKNIITHNSVISSNGTIGSSDYDWVVSDFIEVASNTPVSINKARYVAEYDKFFRFVSDTYQNINPEAQTSFTTNARTKFIRFGTTGANTDYSQVEYGSNITEYEKVFYSVFYKGNKVFDLKRSDGEPIDNEQITEIRSVLEQQTTDLSSLETLMNNIIDGDVTTVLESEAVATNIRNKLTDLETTYAPKLTRTEEKAYSPKLFFSQVVSRGSGINKMTLNSDYITFSAFYHVYDIEMKTTGLVYALQQHLSSSTKQGVYKSLDGGMTWKKVGDLDIDAPNGVWYEDIYVEPFQETYYLIKRNNGYNNPKNNDIVSFDDSLNQVGSMNLGDAGWLGSSHNIDSCANDDYTQRITMFAEYAWDSQAEVNVWKTTDKGANWEKVFSQTGNNGVVYSGEVRHFHTLQIDPFTKDWWLSSGDGNPQCKIWRSEDVGETWELLYQGSQRERLCSFVFEKDYIYYGMDSAQSTTDHSKIVRIRRSDLSREDVATVDMGYAVYCLTRTYYPEGFLVWSQYEHVANQPIDRFLIEFYDYHTEKLYSVATVSTKDIPKDQNIGYRIASRFQDMATGNVFVSPTDNLQQLKYGTTTVSKFLRANLSM